MQNLSQPNTDFLLEVSMEDLHKNIDIWLSEIAFWRDELSFFKNLLEKVANKITSIDDKKRIYYFQNLILYYQEELLDQFQHEIREHELYLKNLIQNKNFVSDQLYRESHQKFENRLSAFNKNMKEFKKELYQFIERIA